MIDEAQIKSVAVFYLFAALDENVAMEATKKTIKLCQARLKSSENPAEDAPAIIVKSIFRHWTKLRKKLAPGHASISYEGSWKLPANVNLDSWKQFKKDGDEDEFLAVLFSQVIKFSDEQIAKGLGVTSGTIRHRVARGLRALAGKQQHSGGGNG